MRIQREVSSLQLAESSCWHPGLRLPAPQTVRNTILLFIIHSVYGTLLQQPGLTKTLQTTHSPCNSSGSPRPASRSQIVQFCIQDASWTDHYLCLKFNLPRLSSHSKIHVIPKFAFIPTLKHFFPLNHKFCYIFIQFYRKNYQTFFLRWPPH